MGAADHDLLRAVRDGLRQPFADPVTVAGVSMTRKMARAIERQMVCIAVRERRAA